MKRSILFLVAASMMLISTAASEQYARGDVNQDGAVNIKDVTCLINYLMSGSWSGGSAADQSGDLQRGDLSRDGMVNIKDVTTLINYLLGQDWPKEPFALQDETITVGDVSFTMVAVEGGTYLMGGTEEQGTESSSLEKPVHEVTLSDYYIGQTEVTQALWTAVMGSNPSYFTSAKGFGDIVERPVESVTWDNCQEFITRLSEMTGRQFRMPTEAEWQYAARGGNKTQANKYAGSSIIDAVAWYRVNSMDVGNKNPDYGTHAVATKAANELGLYDMSGNVNEWCSDWYGSYTEEAQNNPTGPETGTSRMCPGGSWGSLPAYCRVSYRARYAPTMKSNIIGLRLVMIPE